MIVDSHLVLAYPFTSPAYVAAHLGVPAIYHDPTGAILRQDFSDLPDGLPFTSSGQALFEEAKALLGKHGEIAGNWR
jgi:polysaccharide biosynthesis PFTS motif protein